MATIKKTVQLDFTGQFKEIEEGLRKALNAASSKGAGKGFKEKFEGDIKESIHQKILLRLQGNQGGVKQRQHRH